MVAALMAAGCAPEVAAEVVARAFVAGVNSANSTGIPVDKVAEKRRAYDRERKRNSGGIPPETTGIPNPPLSSLNKEEEKGRKRGARLAGDWVPSEVDRAFAKDLGWSDNQIDAEAANFRDHWIAKPGADACKLDWPATWRKWIRGSKIKPVGSSLRIVSPVDRDWKTAAKSWTNFRTWPRGYGPDPDSPSCECPRELLA